MRHKMYSVAIFTLASAVSLNISSAAVAQVQKLPSASNPATVEAVPTEGLVLHISPIGVQDGNNVPILVKDDQIIVLDLAITNSGTQTKTFFEQGNAVDEFVISVKNSDGSVVPFTAYGNRFAQPPNRKLIRRFVSWDVAPGKDLHFYVWMNKIFDLSLCVQFTVQAQRTLPELPGQKGAILVSNILTFNTISAETNELVDKAETEQKSSRLNSRL